MTIVLASMNPHKQEELSALFHGHTLLIPQDLGVSYHHEEIGSTYLENSLGKARTLHKLLLDAGRSTYPIIADDSGLSIPALKGEPGVYSARFGEKELGRKPTYEEQHHLLLERMRSITDRKAYFICCMVLLIHPERWFVAQETLEGEIAFNPRGTGGFGYDPLLYLPWKGRTVAELSLEEKNQVSHRGLAARAIRSILENHLEKNPYEST
ncbi:MAG: RdgB/HAM1 family non-canonical purine NTP pyrophosphatase [Spirochaetes bacterium]|nr:RdgB/HAM1 family non-canonical purine NTP pyrophosphatase [Spirochaetota bacterium]